MPIDAPAFPQRRILVVDDEPAVCEAVKMLLEFDGHEVVIANSAVLALAEFETGKFDLVITDFLMPGMKGDELAAAIKERAPEQPVIMLTAFAGMLPRPLCGVDFVVPKPFMLENMREAIAHVAPSNALKKS